jgi:uncharacterized repeat protein (TIGR03803 family)
VFELTPGGQEKVLHSFAGGTDGKLPVSALIADAAGNLYGTTAEGGSTGCTDVGGCGTVFKLASDGTETVLYAFQGTPDGDFPTGSVVMDQAGNLYGTTSSGGADDYYGTIFKVSPSGAETVLHSFTGGSDGAYPSAGVIADQAGNLYGTAQAGGGANKHGTVYELKANGALTVLHAFTSGKDGAKPRGGLVTDNSGNLYGTTQIGGGAKNAGAVFKLAPNGTETILHKFNCNTDGCKPIDGLIADSAGNLYGTTELGSDTNSGSPGNERAKGYGTVFKLQE